MLTPQELQEKKFRKAAFGGYDMQEIDDFLDSVTGDYERLYKENAILKGKLKTLADKVEEYRASDDDMRRTFAEAKRTAEATVADAKAEGERILAEAKEKSAEIERESRSAYERKLAEVNASIESEQLRLDRAKQSTSSFIAAITEACRVELENLKHLSSLVTGEMETPAAPAIPAVPAAPAAPAAEPKSAADVKKEPTRRFDLEDGADAGDYFGAAREVTIDGGVTGEETAARPFEDIFGRED